MQREATTLSRLRHEHHPLRQLVRFGLVGVCTLLADFSVYRGMLYAGVPLSLAKALGFVVGTTCAYLLNRSWTFKAAGGRGPLSRFLAVYAVTLGVNVAVNALGVRLLQGRPYRIELAFLAAQAISSALNFVGLRQIVFVDRVSRPGRGTRS